MSDVFVLGAGFSRAISSEMPMLAQLGDEVVKRMERSHLPDGLRIQVRDFENWLSYLSEDQPWLSEAEHYRNRAAFLTVSRIVGEVIRECEEKVRSRPMPAWLGPLVARWHEDRATVITFNYDNLVEAAYVETVSVRSSFGDSQKYTSTSQLRRSALTPIRARSGGVLTAPQVDTFTLCKLHGSRTWFYSGRPSFYGETIFEADLDRSWTMKHTVESWLIEDKVPLVVPPTAVKSGFFNNEVIRHEWNYSHLKLRDAERIWFVGYSFPETDLLVRFLVQQSCAINVQAIVVNPDTTVVDRVTKLLSATGSMPKVSHIATVEDMAATLQPSNPSPIAFSRP